MMGKAFGADQGSFVLPFFPGQGSGVALVEEQKVRRRPYRDWRARPGPAYVGVLRTAGDFVNVRASPPVVRLALQAADENGRIGTLTTAQRGGPSPAGLPDPLGPTVGRPSPAGDATHILRIHQQQVSAAREYATRSSFCFCS